MQIQSYKPIVSNPVIRREEEQPSSPTSGHDRFEAQEPGSELESSRPNCAQTGALYGGLAGSGIAVALGCMTFGVGLMAGFATVPLGIALGAGLGAVADMVRAS